MADQDAASTPAVAPHFDLALTPQEQALIAQRTPLRFHTYTPANAASTTDPVLEPYLPLGSPTSSSTSTSTTSPLSLILTPPRPQDAAALVSTLNDPLVAPQLVGPPYPYSDELAREFISLKRREAHEVLQRLAARARRELRRACSGEEQVAEGEREGDEPLDVAAPWLDELPLCVIRRADTGEYVGDFGVHRWLFEDVVDAEERGRLVRENEAKKASDPSALWSFGFYLRPSFHGHGIMAHVLRSVLDSFLFSYLGIDEVCGSAFADNVASVRTQEKCGLRRYGGYERVVSASRGGGVRSMVVLKVTRADFARR
ncbi:hypothetical protein JCM8208_003437 [Rhodotorula glutinis]